MRNASSENLNDRDRAVLRVFFCYEFLKLRHDQIQIVSDRLVVGAAFTLKLLLGFDSQDETFFLA